MEKRIETAINLIMFLSLLATAWISLWCTIFHGNAAAAPDELPVNE